MTLTTLPRGVPSGWLRALLLPLIVLTWLTLLVLCLWVLSHFTHTILLVVLAAVLAFAFTPLANVFARRIPRGWAIALAYLVGLIVVFGCGAYVVATAISQIAALVANLPDYIQQAQALQPQAENLLTPFGLPPEWIPNLEAQTAGEVQTVASAVARDLLPRLAEFFGTVIDVVLVLILSVYMTLDGTRIAEFLQTRVPGQRARTRARVLVTVVNRVIGGYVRGVLSLALLVGALVGAGLAIIGLPYGVLLGVLAFFMEFVPVLGVIISGAASVVIALVYFRDLLHPLVVLAYFVFVHVIEGDVVGPRIMGRAVGIHPATGMVALVAGTEVFGVWGALFAAPLAGLIQAIIVAAWVELRGGNPDELVQAVADSAGDKAEEHTGVTAAT